MTEVYQSSSNSRLVQSKIFGLKLCRHRTGHVPLKLTWKSSQCSNNFMPRYRFTEFGLYGLHRFLGDINHAHVILTWSQP
jgi:hypothetical protein